ncbi:hypothetical protein UFOVP336_20 [uncultured Caudovirales phage]|uniref:Uncharacterized protein n=1 Tax=uncultured Caudovirales phage TaxID=2100421 RepID=A0A6J5M5N8_9CAUD|nr:hypothetical protein UFOVP336_20 [uncultured Caudovirales phage]
MSNQLAEAARQYLIATAHLGACPGTRDVLGAAIAAHEDSLREKAAKPAEPVAFVDERAIAWLESRRASALITTQLGSKKSLERPMALYAAPVAAASPLSDEQLLEILGDVDADTKRLPPGVKAFARAIEQAHGIKEKTNG